MSSAIARNGSRRANSFFVNVLRGKFDSDDFKFATQRRRERRLQTSLLFRIIGTIRAIRAISRCQGSNASLAQLSPLNPPYTCPTL